MPNRPATQAPIALPPVVSRDEWLHARTVLLAKEKEQTRARDALNAERRRLPMVKIDKDYVFEGPHGPARLLDLFDGRRQLLIYHFMLEPDADEGCPGCSHLADNIPHLSHLHARDTTLVLVSRAPQSKIVPFQKRMGWTVPWYSSFGSDFNYDFHVTLDPEVGSVEWNYQSAEALRDAGKIPEAKGELPGLSVFLRDGDEVYHTYSTYARGLDGLLATHHYLDMTPFGRGEGWDDMPDLTGEGMWWLRHHDRYQDDSLVELTTAPTTAETADSCRSVAGDRT